MGNKPTNKIKLIDSLEEIPYQSDKTKEIVERLAEIYDSDLELRDKLEAEFEESFIADIEKNEKSNKGKWKQTNEEEDWVGYSEFHFAMNIIEREVKSRLRQKMLGNSEQDIDEHTHSIYIRLLTDETYDFFKPRGVNIVILRNKVKQHFQDLEKKYKVDFLKKLKNKKCPEGLKQAYELCQFNGLSDSQFNRFMNSLYNDSPTIELRKNVKTIKGNRAKTSNLIDKIIDLRRLKSDENFVLYLQNPGAECFEFPTIAPGTILSAPEGMVGSTVEFISNEHSGTDEPSIHDLILVRKEHDDRMRRQEEEEETRRENVEVILKQKRKSQVS